LSEREPNTSRSISSVQSAVMASSWLGSKLATLERPGRCVSSLRRSFRIALLYRHDRQ
jgi:hypothetical protein